MRALFWVLWLSLVVPVPVPAAAAQHALRVDAPAETPDAQDPPRSDTPPDGEHKDPDRKSEDEDGDRRRTPTPEDPQDIPLPRGYAPETPQAFLKGPMLWLVQYVAVLGIRGLTAPLMFVPVLGFCAAFVSPLLEATLLTYVGDRVGPFRSALLWPTIAAYLVHIPAAAVTVSVASLGQLLLLVSVPLVVGALVSRGTAPPVMGPALATGLAVAGAGAVFLALGVGGAVLVGNLVAPTMMLLAYHLSSRPKRGDDNGSDLPRILPRGRGLPLPRMFRGEDREEEDDDDDGRRTPVSTGVAP